LQKKNREIVMVSLSRRSYHSATGWEFYRAYRQLRQYSRTRLRPRIAMGRVEYAKRYASTRVASRGRLRRSDLRSN
jgi:hypothetical protein